MKTLLILGLACLSSCARAPNLGDSVEKSTPKLLAFSLPAATYDAGPAPASPFVKLFADATLTNEITAAGGPRNLFGPAAYRGRLEANQVKVLILGQDDSGPNISQRAFSGFVGRELQHLLEAIGIHYSYLFLHSNPFDSNWSDTPALNEYRLKLLDFSVQNNSDSLAAILAVGPAGKKMLSSWIEAHGGKCKVTLNLSQCSTLAIERDFKVKRPLQIVGIPQPSLYKDEQIDASFQQGLDSILSKAKSDQEWLPVDSETLIPALEQPNPPARRQTLGSQYGRRFNSLPAWDYPFGTSPDWLAYPPVSLLQLSSQRLNIGAPKRQADEGSYPLLQAGAVLDPSHPIPEKSKTELADFWPLFFAEQTAAYDHGPCNGAVNCAWSQFLQAQNLMYRGRLDQARVLVIADPLSGDDLISRRALTGDTGQKLQSFLTAMGITQSYAIIQSAPLDTMGLSESKRQERLGEPYGMRLRRALFDKILRESKPEIVLTIGPVSQLVWDQLKDKTKAYALAPSDQKDHVELWNQLLQTLSKRSYHRDSAATFSYSGRNTTIPRQDLPFHTPWWFGSGGNRVVYKYAKGVMRYQDRKSVV